MKYDKCPKCKSTDTRLHHDLQEDLWKSICKKCGYESKETNNYDDAWAWRNSKINRMKDEHKKN